MSNRFEKCHCCMSPAGGSDQTFKLVHGKRVVELYGKEVTQYYCAKHAAYAPHRVPVKPEGKPGPRSEAHKLLLLEAIARLDATQQAYTVEKLIKESGLHDKNYYGTTLQEIGAKASANSREVEYRVRVEWAIAELEQRGARCIRHRDIFERAGISWYIYRERPALKRLVEEAIVRSGGKVDQRFKNGGQRKSA